MLVLAILVVVAAIGSSAAIPAVAFLGPGTLPASGNILPDSSNASPPNDNHADGPAPCDPAVCGPHTANGGSGGPAPVHITSFPAVGPTPADIVAFSLLGSGMGALAVAIGWRVHEMRGGVAHKE